MPTGVYNHKGREKHGHNRKGNPSPEYQAYANARSRCLNLKHPRYKDYGGRGIEFRFKNFQEFLSYIGLKPSPKLTLDRIENDVHYEIGNVQWTTAREQALNRRERSQ